MVDSVLSVVIVTFNSRAEVDACLSSLFDDLGDRPAQVVVVDNASGDGTPEWIEARGYQVTLLTQNRNHGFAAANNIGIKHTRGDPILLLNPDTIVQAGALDTLLTALKKYSDVGVVGPLLLNKDGSLQPSCRDFPSLLGDFIGMTEFYRLAIVRRAFGNYLTSLSDHQTARRVDWLSGACLLVRRSAIDAAGLLDEGFFLYSEELEWQYRMARCGWRTRFEPAAHVVHLGGTSTSAVPGQRIVWQYQSILRFYRLYRNVFQRAALRLLIWAVTMPKILVLTIIGRGQPRRQELRRAFWQVLWLR